MDYRRSIRIILILYYFGEHIDDIKGCRLIKSEVRIQKIEFLFRYPDYLANEILLEYEKDISKYSRDEIKNDIDTVLLEIEPDISRELMLKYLYGAYEKLDDIIAFLKSYGLIKLDYDRSINNNMIDKEYYLTNKGKEFIENNLMKNMTETKWYLGRYQIIKKYFGDLKGIDLRNNQYSYEKYRNTELNHYIDLVEDEFKINYKKVFGDDYFDKL